MRISKVLLFTAFLAFAMLASTALAQDTLVPSSTVYPAKPGNTVTVPFTLSLPGQPDTNIAAMDVGLNLPAGFAVTGVFLPLTMTNKQLTCTPNQVRCIVWGLDASKIPNGQFITFQVLVPPAATGSNQITFTNLMGADPTGSLATIIGTGPTIQIITGQDLNADGKVDVVDLKLMIDQILGISACTGDQNGDSKCDLKDFTIIFLKMLAGG